MQSRDFCYWLQGFFEINGETKPLTVEQVSLIKKHLHMVFKHEIDPSFGESLDELKSIHDETSKEEPKRRPGKLVDDFDWHNAKVMC